MFDLEERVEMAVKAAFIARNVLPENMTIVMAQENVEREEPCFLIGFADGGVPDQEVDLEYATGNRQGILTLAIQVHSDHGKADHRELVDAIRGCLYKQTGDTTTLQDEINALAVGVAVDQFFPTDSTRIKEENSFYTILSVEVVVRPVMAE